MMLTEPIVFTLAGHPQGKGRARSGRTRDGRPVHYTPAMTRSYESMIRYTAQQEMAGRQPTDRPIKMDIRAVFAMPKGWSKVKVQAALVGDIKPSKRPDLDNIEKAVSDALNSVVYQDDCQIVQKTSIKVYGLTPMIVVSVKPL